jgi:hypothetical protein
MTGCLLGVSLWVKLPGILAAPALGFVFPRWRDRLAFGASLLVTGALTYVPLLVIDPDIVFRRVLSYQGLVILTSAGVRIWGLQNFLYLTGALPGRVAAAELQRASAVRRAVLRRRVARVSVEGGARRIALAPRARPQSGAPIPVVGARRPDQRVRARRWP